jgi:hypothetical protein
MPLSAHNPLLSDISQILLGDVALVLCFFTPGYLVAAASNVMGFRLRSLAEKILWSIALSAPLSILLTSIVARALPATAIMAIVIAAGAAGLFLFVRDLLNERRQQKLGFDRSVFDRSFWIIVAAMLVVALYCIAATVGIQTQHSLYESIVSADWSIRVPLVEAATRGGLPPLNPMYALAGHAPAMRYYYFWYEICALLMRLTHISPRAALTATTAWSAYTLLSVLLLTIKYLGTTTTLPQLWPVRTTDTPGPTASLRRICVVATGLICVMGLDLLAAVRDLLSKPRVVFPDIEAWHTDRMPSWVGAILFAPHHIAGVAFGCVAFLLLAIVPTTRRQQAIHALLAACCFAALVGTSTYLAVCFALAGLLLFLLRLKHRDGASLAVMAGCTVVAVLIAAPFLHEMASTTTSVTVPIKPGEAHSLLSNSMFKLVLSNWHAAYGTVGDFSHAHGLHLDRGPLRYILPLFVLPVYFLMELTFYVFVLWYQAVADFRSGKPISERSLLLWILFLGFALPGLFLSSEPVQGINDLERHCGLALRLVLITWAAPMFANTLLRLRSRAFKPTLAGRWIIGLTTVMMIIGLGGQLWQITMDRLYYPLVLHGKIASKVQFGAGAPFLQIRRASDFVAAHFPANAIVQDNQDGPFQSLFLLYGHQQFAAGDESCEAAFGGDINLCKQDVVKPLHKLFGGTIDSRHYDPGETLPEPPDPANMTPARFAETCRKLHLSVLMASKDDAAWGMPGTWVWREPALYADDATRVIACPQ